MSYDENKKNTDGIGWLTGVPKTQARPYHGCCAFRGSDFGLPLRVKRS